MYVSDIVYEKWDYIEESTCDFESIDLKENVLKILVQNWYNLPNMVYCKPLVRQGN